VPPRELAQHHYDILYFVPQVHCSFRLCFVQNYTFSARQWPLGVIISVCLDFLPV